MITEISGKAELEVAVREAVAALRNVLLSLDEQAMNTVPFNDSWTAAQVAQHVSKSTNFMAKAMATEPKDARRRPDEKIPELKKIFLDFSTKLKSPDFIIPEEGHYAKEAVTEKLDRAFERLQENVGHANLNDLVENLPFGPTTKLELLHFVVYHTQRHLNQLTKIAGALKNP
jgi:hypothetical protein